MRHGKKFNHLGRKRGHRKALLRNLSIALIEHKRINTTVAKAKALRKFFEPLITKAKTDSVHSRRVVFSYLQNKEALQELFGPIAEKVGNRPGGYLRIIKTYFRQGDNAEMAMIEFVDFNENLLQKGEDDDDGRRTRRSRRRKSNTTTPVAEVEEKNNNLEEEVDDVADDKEDEKKVDKPV